MINPRFTPAASLAVAGLVAVSSPALAQTHSVYGYDFVTIGDAGNRPTNDSELSPVFSGQRIGAVEYEYQMATTEVTIGQYLEFVRAYAPHYAVETGNGFLGGAFSGPGITGSISNPTIRAGYSSNRAAQMGWEFAARYCNWLHNGKVNEAWAFQNGAYDTSTFTQNLDGSFNHQETRNAGARFWIPSLDEWTKAAHWDPEKNDGQGGYWKFSNSSDLEPIGNLLPDEGGQRNAGDGDPFPLDVGSFADVSSPWGLLDLAGGEPEMLETALGEAHIKGMAGSTYLEWANGNPFSRDIIGIYGTVFATGSGGGLRLAHTVPSPLSISTLSVAIVLLSKKRTR